MPIETLPTHATESSTYIVTVTFTDEDGDAVVPATVSWTLEDEDGNIINGRSSVEETPASSIELVLKGDDLDPGDETVGNLLLTVNATYNSSLGTAMPLVGQCRLKVNALLP